MATIRERKKLGEKKDDSPTLFDVAPIEPPTKSGPFKAIYVHFECREDMEEFSKLIGQRIDRTTPVIWFPELKIEEVS